MERVDVRDPVPAGGGQRHARQALHGVGVHHVGLQVDQDLVETPPGAAVVDVETVEEHPAVGALARRLGNPVRPRHDGMDDVGSFDPERDDVHLVTLAAQARRQRRGVLLGATDDLRGPEVGDHQNAHRSRLGYCRACG